MGNDASTYTMVDKNNNEDLSSLPKINPFHRKGKPYGAMLKQKLESKCFTDWSHLKIYDLRNGEPTWWLDSQVFGDEIYFKLHLIRNKDDKKEIYFTFPLRYSSESINYMTILKGENKGHSVKLELYADNIHCQTLANLELKHNPQFFYLWIYNIL